MFQSFMSLVIAVVVFASAVPSQSVTQHGEPGVEYGAISGNAFELFKDVTGTGVEVVAFGPASIDADYGVVLKNFTDDPVYGVYATGQIAGDDGTSFGVVSEEIDAPYAIPTNGLVIQWGSTFRGDTVGDDASFDADVGYSTKPQGDGTPRVPVPIDEISRDDEIITAHITNDYPFDLSAGQGHLICFDDDGKVTHADSTKLAEDAYQVQPIPSGEEANYDFDLPKNIDCDYFLVGAPGLDQTTETLDAGSARIANRPQVPSQSEQAGSSRQSTTASGPRSTQVPASTNLPASGCDPSYPGVCIPTFPGYDNLNCTDVSYRDFEVLPPDPYVFDRVPKDGIGCEADANQPPVSPTPTAGVSDTDSDGVRDHDDNCPRDFNPDQADRDSDGIGDVCDYRVDPDADLDGIPDDFDNCTSVANPEQIDSDGNGVGDECDEVVVPPSDADGDGVPDSVDNCIFVANLGQTDSDGNGVGDACDEVVVPSDNPVPVESLPSD